jgi:hypothetical protein
MSLIKQMHGGKEYDATFGKRKRGEGIFAELIQMRFKMACKRWQLNQHTARPLDISQFKKTLLPAEKQMNLF